MPCERCDELQEELRQLRELFIGKERMDPKQYGLTPSEAGIYSLLFRRRGLMTAREHLIIAMRSHLLLKNDIEYEDKMLEVHIHRLRKKLAAHNGPAIHTVRAFGYMMDKAYAQPSIGHETTAQSDCQPASDVAKAKRRYLHFAAKGVAD